MLSQVQDYLAEQSYQDQCAELVRLSISPVTVPSIFIHLVTLVKRSTGDEVLLNIETLSDRFSDVMNEVNYQRSLLKLVGYEYHESLPLNEPPF